MAAASLEVAAGARAIVVDRARELPPRPRPALLERGATIAVAPDLEAMAVALDERGLLPHHGIPHRHRDRVVRLAAAGAAGATIDGGLPAHAGAELRGGATAVAGLARRLPAALDGVAPPAHVTPGAGGATLAV